MGGQGLVVANATKSFADHAVLRQVTLSVPPRSVHGLVGANGAGKSTLVKILSGYHAPDGGTEISVGGVPLPLPIRRPWRHGLAIVQQELGLADDLTVSENVLIGTARARRMLTVLTKGAARARITEVLSSLGVDIDPETPLHQLGGAARALVAVARAILQIEDSAAELPALVLDEPTAYLSEADAALFLRSIRSLADRGASVLLISHHLREVLEHTDQIVVLRDGVVVSTEPSATLTETGLVELMFGRSLDVSPEGVVSHSSERRPRLRCRGIGVTAARTASFDVYPGEILGITGLAGMGHDAIPYLVAGSSKGVGASILDDEPLEANPVRTRRRGVCLLPGNRQRDGVWGTGTLVENLTIASLDAHTRHATIRRRSELESTDFLFDRLNVRPADPYLHMSAFSGGNQQKILLGRLIAASPVVLLCHEPTQGVDVASQLDIVDALQQLATESTAVVVCGSDYQALSQMCTRVLVLRDGAVTAELRGAEISEDAILVHCSGGRAA